MTTAEGTRISAGAEHPCENPPAVGAKFPQFCERHAAAYASADVCRTAGCSYPAGDVRSWADRARDQVPRYWLDQFIAEGNPASPDGTCTDCGADWLGDLKNYRDKHRCDGGCSPYSNCMCRLMLPEDEY